MSGLYPVLSLAVVDERTRAPSRTGLLRPCKYASPHFDEDVEAGEVALWKRSRQASSVVRGPINQAARQPSDHKQLR